MRTFLKGYLFGVGGMSVLYSIALFLDELDRLNARDYRE